MTRMLQAIVLVSGLVFFFGLAGLAYYAASPMEAPQQQQGAAQPETKQPAKKEHSLSGFVNFLFPDAISIFTFWLVIATIVLGIIAYLQIDFLKRAEAISAQAAKAAKDSSDIAEKALIAANRPWIKADIQPGRIFYDVNGVNFTLRFIIKNIGHSPATNIMPNPKIIAPAIGVKPEDGGDTESFNPRAEMLKIVASHKTQTANPFGTALFPDEFVVQDFIVIIGKDELKRITRAVPEFIAPTVVGTIVYRMGFDSQVHQTGFIIAIGRKSARPDRADTAIFPDEGDIAADRVIFSRSLLDGGYAD